MHSASIGRVYARVHLMSSLVTDNHLKDDDFAVSTVTLAKTKRLRVQSLCVTTLSVPIFPVVKDMRSVYPSG